MEDEKPSQYLRRLQALAGTAVPDDLLRTLWMRGLPEKLKPTMATQTGKTLPEMAEVADCVQPAPHTPRDSRDHRGRWPSGTDAAAYAAAGGVTDADVRHDAPGARGLQWGRRTAVETVAPAFALATPIQVQRAATRRIVLVPLEVPAEGQEVYTTLLVDAGKPVGQSLMAASDTCPVTSRRLFVRDKASGIRFLVDTGADMCVFPRHLVPGRLQKSEYLLSAANGTPIATYGTRTMTLNRGEISVGDFL
jgi:hypothetical protein